MVWERRPQQGRDRNPVSPADFFDWREQAGVFEHLSAYSQGGANLTGTGEPERLLSAHVSDGFFELFGTSPFLGGTLASEEQSPGAHLVAILSHGLWSLRFGSDPSPQQHLPGGDRARATVVVSQRMRGRAARQIDICAAFP